MRMKCAWRGAGEVYEMLALPSWKLARRQLRVAAGLGDDQLVQGM